MKKINIFMSIVLIIIMLTSCSSKNSSDIKWDFNNNVGEEWKNSQDYLLFGLLSESPSGYYYVVVDNSNSENIIGYVYFFDKQSNKASVLCNLPNCRHNDDKCTAFFDKYVSKGVKFINGYLFYIVSDDNRNRYLYRMDSDGANKTKVMEISNGKECYSAQVDYYGDNLFITYTYNDSKKSLYKYNIKENVKIKILDYSGTSQNMVFNEGKIFINDRNVASSSTLYEYDIEEANLKKLTNKLEIVNIVYIDGNLLCTTSTGIQLYNLQLDEFTNIFSGGIYQISYDGKYIYADDILCKDSSQGRQIHVLDMNYTEIYKIDMNDFSMEPCLFGNKDFMFIKDNKTQTMYFFEKSKIETNNGNWNKVEDIGE